MKRTNIIRGKPIYIHKRRQYVYQPEKTIIRVMKHDAVENITFVYCVKPTLIPEFIMTIILVVFAVFNILLNVNTEIIHYNKEAIYHDGLLYLNIKSESNNYYEIGYDLLDSSGNGVIGGILEPGDLVTTVAISSPESSYTLMFSYETLLGLKKKTVNVTVMNKDEKSVNGVYENE